ncbi:MAG: chemotaxis protein CheW [Gallionella sp.]
MAKRTNLREFQQNLSDRMSAGDSDKRQISTLGVLIAGKPCLVDMSEISEVLSPQTLVTVPMAKPWVKGVSNVRGNLYCVTDIAAYLKLGEASGGMDNRLLLVAERYAFNSALLVDKVLGLRDARDWRASEADLTDEQGVVWRKLDIANLLSQAEFLQIGA